MAGRRGSLLILLALLQPGCVLLDSARQDAHKLVEPTMLPPVESARACQAVAENLAREGHIEQAIEQMLKARAFDPRIDVSPVLARLYARLGNDRMTRDEFARALKEHPKDADLWNDLGYYHYQHGNWVEAEQHFRKVVELDAKHARGWTNLGLALGQQSKYPDALEAFEKSARPAEARCNLAFVLCTQGKRDRARELYQDALRLDPGLPLARAALARMDRRAQPAPPVQASQPAPQPKVQPAQTTGKLTIPPPPGSPG
jgi:Tfp pilus assembly protein PilF